MGGSSGGTIDYTPGGGGESNRDCDQVRFSTTLLSPDPKLLKSLFLNQVLKVTVKDLSVLVVNSSNQRVGSLVTKAAELISCIQKGHRYEAVVTQIEHGACRVNVRYAGR